MMHYRLLPESEVWIRQKTNLYEKVVNDKTISSSTPFVKVKLSIYYGVIRARQLWVFLSSGINWLTPFSVLCDITSSDISYAVPQISRTFRWPCTIPRTKSHYIFANVAETASYLFVHMWSIQAYEFLKNILMFLLILFFRKMTKTSVNRLSFQSLRRLFVCIQSSAFELSFVAFYGEQLCN